jgi:hypothetical protein
VIAELKNPKVFPKALTLLQTIDISIYLVAGVAIYYFVGQDVESPVLGSISPLVFKTAYGIALPTVSFLFIQSYQPVLKIIDHHRWGDQRPHCL